ncbi:glycoside hydrolase family 2 protein [Marinihelvus fidelis]|uniref:Glycoside hydrolase family 2 protein n=1 Tax=Marinihelvus fidelis TaxID=2613842 RepID=A0A5N0TDA3_9GAMM|nr:beta-galactosidase GalB [Marinihelvus fidelis]KAA9132731.1 glycoside hydrolase family 2 protein [Marinihelvus fidelis]
MPRLPVLLAAVFCLLLAPLASPASASTDDSPRLRVSLNDGWRFMKYGPDETPDGLVYDVRPEVTESSDGRPADAEPTEAVEVAGSAGVLKPWVLPTANEFIDDPKRHHARPAHEPVTDLPLLGHGFDDGDWARVTLPHDWAIGGPFMVGEDVAVGGGMGRLPSPGVAWYRRSLDIPADWQGQQVTLEVGGAMAYAMVWINGHLAGGWPYGYASWQVDLTPYLVPGGDNLLAIRMDNPPESSRWYPGGGLYRNVWLTRQDPVHVTPWGVHVISSDISNKEAKIKVISDIKNTSSEAARVSVETAVYVLGSDGLRGESAVTETTAFTTEIRAGARARVEAGARIAQPRLWGPPPNQSPHRYLAVTRLSRDGQVIDKVETRFGIRELKYDSETGLWINGERIELKGANQHHDLGALGAAWNSRAAERQLEMLQAMGANAIRTAHNPPAPELLDLADRMGILVVDEIFDVWARKKTPLDFHLVFDDWSEPDLRAFLRRDRNHPSVIMWSLGNEVGEQYTGDDGAAVARRLQAITKQEDPTRPTGVSMNFAKPGMPLPAVMDMVHLNYQGEGIRDAPGYAHLQGIRTSPMYPAFRQAYPEKVILSSENAAAVSSRGEYLFPVAEGDSAPVADGAGGDPVSAQVSSYELYTAPFGSSADKVFRSLAQHPYVAGGFVWSGWDYLGEPTPYYSARSSYFGVIDLAGFPKDRYYLYQAHWRPDYPMAHLLPHWNWPGREGRVTPVHVFTSGDEAELFLNGESLGRKKKGELQFRIRWDDVVYTPGELEVRTWRNGEPWATDRVVTTGPPAALVIEPDRGVIRADGLDLAFLAVRVVDANGHTVANADTALRFSIEGPGEIVATDNGDPTDMTGFHATERSAFNGLALVIVRALPGQGAGGSLTVSAQAEGLEPASRRVKLGFWEYK